MTDSPRTADRLRHHEGTYLAMSEPLASDDDDLPQRTAALPDLPESKDAVARLARIKAGYLDPAEVREWLGRSTEP